MSSLRPPIEDDPERILVTGGPKVGKTTSYLSIAARCPDDKMYVLNSDRAMRRMLANRGLSNIETRSVSAWEDYVEGVRELSAIVKPNDWIVVDFISTAWEAIQSWYIEKRFGKSSEDFFNAHAMAAKKGNPLDGDKDWSVINRNHRTFMHMLQDVKCHVLATTTAKAVGERDDPQLKSTYGFIGVRPTGQKELSHEFHTLVVLTKDRQGKHVMTTVGDRERRLIEKAPWSDFSTSYLMTVAGWRPGS